MTAEVRNLLVYVATAILPPVADAAYQAIQAQTVAGKTIDWSQVAIVALLALLSSYVASTRPKAGHAEISELADSAGHAAAKTALTETVAAQIAGVASTPFTPAQVAQLVDALHEPVATDLEARMKATA